MLRLISFLLFFHFSNFFFSLLSFYFLSHFSSLRRLIHLFHIYIIKKFPTLEKISQKLMPSLRPLFFLQGSNRIVRTFCHYTIIEIERKKQKKRLKRKNKRLSVKGEKMRKKKKGTSLKDVNNPFFSFSFSITPAIF